MSASRANPPVPPLERSARATILLVDDSVTIRAMLTHALRREFDLVEAKDGLEAWTAIGNDARIELVITDLAMPNLDGYGLLAKIRKSDAARINNMPVIVLAGAEDTAARERVFTEGANDFIAKTSDRVELLARVRAHQKLAQTIRELEESRSYLKNQASTDALTKLTNRRYFFEFANKHMATMKRTQQPFSLIMLDVDHFKAINDTYGHQAGDYVLMRIAETLRTSIREEDIVARVGGEEFALALPATNRLAAVVLAERLRKAVEVTPLRYNRNQIEITISLGLAAFNQDGETVDQLMAVADQRLYQAKQRGRNCFVASDKPSDDTPEATTADPLSLVKAVVMARHGNVDKLRDRLPALMGELVPLLALARDSWQLPWDMEALQAEIARREKA